MIHMFIFTLVCALAASAEVPLDEAENQDDDVSCLIQLDYDMRLRARNQKVDLAAPHALTSEHELSEEQTAILQKEVLASPLAVIPEDELSQEEKEGDDKDQEADADQDAAAEQSPGTGGEAVENKQEAGDEADKKDQEAALQDLSSNNSTKTINETKNDQEAGDDAEKKDKEPVLHDDNSTNSKNITNGTKEEQVAGEEAEKKAAELAAELAAKLAAELANKEKKATEEKTRNPWGGSELAAASLVGSGATLGALFLAA